MKKLLISLPLALAFALTPLASSAETFPSKTVRWVVPYPAGGGSDFMARTVTLALPELLGQPVIVENKPGGNGAVAVADIKRAPKDGHTIINVDNGILVFNPVLYKKLGYDPAVDLRPVTLLGSLPMILVAGPGTDAKTAKDFIAQVKAQPGKFNYGSAGAGSPQHMAMELLKKIAGLDMQHIAYKGSAPALGDLMGGQIPALMTDYAAGRSAIQAGSIRALAVASPERLGYLPDVPTFAELGLQDMNASAFVGVAVAAGTPDAAVLALQKAISGSLARPEVAKRYRDIGIEPVTFTPLQFEELVKTESTRWHKLIREQKISLD